MNNYLTNDKQIILKYERYLSPYGRKVMTTLLNLKKERKTNNVPKVNLNPARQWGYGNKKIISFNHYETPKPCPIIDDGVKVNEINIYNTANQNNNNIIPVPSSNSILTLPYNNISGITANVCQTIDPYVDNNQLNIKQNTIIKESTAHKEVNDKSDDISWDNMFDSDMFELFDDGNAIEKGTETLSEGTLLKPIDMNEKNKFEDNDMTEEATCKTKKDKPQIKKTQIKVSKKSNEKVSFRKEKYTTTINNWLNDVDTANNVPNNVNTLINKNQSPEANKKLNKINKNKRSIQAQLANKDGVMKYKKPKTNDNDGKNYDNDQVTLVHSNMVEDVHVKKSIKESVAKIENKKTKSNVLQPNKKSNTKLVKDKTPPAKFVAPIKSQIPVKDIIYKVVIVNSLIDITTVSKELDMFDGDQCVMTLVYSNGFNQLNRQHTDDTCSPEGIMLCLQDTFYYIEDFADGIKKSLGRILSSSTSISFDAKSILVYLACQYNFVPENLKIFDTKIGCSLISPDEPTECFSEVQKLLGYRAEYTIATDCTLQKAAWYMTLLKECSSKLKDLLFESSLWNLFTDIEMKVLPVIAGMEQRGISVDVTKLKSMEDILMTRIKDIESQCHKAAGKAFNINSAAQVRAIIYDELKLDTATSVKIRGTICKGAKSTSEAMLRPLVGAHPLPRLILEYRHLHKAHATFLAGIAQHVRDGVVKPTWEQAAAATGRIASNNPNLQAIPKMQFNLVLFPDNNDTEVQALNFRSAYVPRAGHSLLAADFKHVECRVFAHAAGDAQLQGALAGEDLFRELAARWRGTPGALVSAEERERTKRIVYASLYGAGTRKLMEILELGYDQVLSIMSSFNRTFPALKSFGRSVVARCEAQGGRLATASGRARTFGDITSTDFHTKSHAERQAVNFIIQGTAADLCKLAMVRCSETLRGAGVQALLLLQIHDELVWEVPHPHLHTAAVIIKRTMESCGEAFNLPPLPVAIYSGDTWGSMEELLSAATQ